ncbi:MAG: oxygen-insensitive NAD(P)H nitroreductase [Spirochaetia bacterium]|jgi:nitroreductase/dihydropteridine reductase|nr:oxygen-insensitive NAD(P)H nitroreductase [Spirochaetia bacterium]
MELQEVLQRRYAVKKFDATKKLTPKEETAIKELLRFSPSSVNIQPWHFIIASTEEGKQRIAKSTEGSFAFNTPKVLDASHVVVFSARKDADEAFLLHLLEKENTDGRFAKPEFMEAQKSGRAVFVGKHRTELNDMPSWLAKQVYLDLGSFLLGVAELGLDAVPMEGFDPTVLDAEFGLDAKGFTSLALVAVGHKGADDFNGALPKSRLDEKEIIDMV